MHLDGTFGVRITQTHSAIVENVATYELDAEAYQEFLELDDTFAKEEFILLNGLPIEDTTDIIEILETRDVLVDDDGQVY